MPTTIGAIVVLKIWAGTWQRAPLLDELNFTAPIVETCGRCFPCAALANTRDAASRRNSTCRFSGSLRDASGNRVIGDSIRGAHHRCGGRPLSNSLEMMGHFPHLALEMIRVGEQTGSLPDMLNPRCGLLRRRCESPIDRAVELG